jgi:hypothetical protein
MKRYSLLQRFSLLSLGAFLIAGLALGAILTSSIEKSAIERSKHETALFVTAEVDRTFPGMDFSLPMTGPRYDLQDPPAEGGRTAGGGSAAAADSCPLLRK